MQLYEAGAKQLIKFYEEKNLVTKVDGRHEVKEVFKEISEKLEEKLQ